MICPHCGEDIQIRGSAYDRHVVTCGKLPETDVLLRMVKRGRGFDDIGRQYGVSGKTVRRRVFMADPFAYKSRETKSKSFGEGHCTRCAILLSCAEAMPAHDGLCAACVYEMMEVEAVT
jgi:ssDNA-binding Zn-finger/Zn-ribbon topoisomerase 1